MKLILLQIALLVGVGSPTTHPDSLHILTVKIPETAEVPGLQFTLGEVLEFASVDAQLVEQAQKIIVGYSPLPGIERILERNAIRNLLAGSGIARSQMRLQGKQFVSVHIAHAVLDANQLLENGENFLKEELQIFGIHDFEIESRTTPTALLIPKGKQGQRLQATWRGEIRERGQVGVDLNVVIDGERYRQIPLAYFVHVFGTTATATQAIRPGEPLNANNVALQRSELPVTKYKVIQNLEELQGRTSARSIVKGEVITEADLRLEPLVMRGESVNVILRDGALTISMRGIAQASGFFGATVTVLNPHSKKEIFGRVVGKGSVEISKNITLGSNR